MSLQIYKDYRIRVWDQSFFFFYNTEKVKQTINIFFIQTPEIFGGEVALLYLIILIKELFNIKGCKTLFIDNLKLKYYFFYLW